MNEEETNEEEESKNSTSDADEGSKPEASTLIDQANSAAERLEEANERKTELLKQEEDLIAKKTLGGYSEAGKSSEKPKEETNQEYVDRMRKAGWRTDESK